MLDLGFYWLKFPLLNHKPSWQDDSVVAGDLWNMAILEARCPMQDLGLIVGTHVGTMGLTKESKAVLPSNSFNMLSRSVQVASWKARRDPYNYSSNWMFFIHALAARRNDFVMFSVVV